MVTLPIVTAPDPRLKQKSHPAAQVDDELRRLMDDMLETMYESNGIGLAAVQVGVLKRVIVMDLDYGSTRYEENPQTAHIEGYKHPASRGNALFLVNPEITATSDEQNIYEEGCLSFPGQYADVTRPKEADIRYLDYDGTPRKIHADGLLATCVQHEMDHLNGVVFVDHVSRLKRNMIMQKMKKQSK